MKDQLISFETAKLAKEKGFEEKTDKGYHRHGTEEDFKPLLLWRDSEEGEPEFGYVPTQSLLQRWLREKYGYHICIIPTVTSSWTFKSINVISEKDNDVIVGLKSVSELPPYKEVNGYDYSTYEEALEFGLREVLRSMP